MQCVCRLLVLHQMPLPSVSETYVYVEPTSLEQRQRYTFYQYMCLLCHQNPMPLVLCFRGLRYRKQKP